MCGGVKLPGISCKGCKKNQGFPKYDKPCHEPEPGMHGKFKCKVLCGPGFTVNIFKLPQILTLFLANNQKNEMHRKHLEKVPVNGRREMYQGQEINSNKVKSTF